MRRLIALFAALFVLLAASTYAQDAAKDAGSKTPTKKAHHTAKHHGKKHHAAHKGAMAAAPGGPFSDVPKGHWAYDAIQKAVDAGILQGYDGKYHGGKVVNRYQMAVVVARMLDKVGVLKANGKVITGQDIANLESLTIEFADELALLNVKVSTLEDNVANLKKDVDAIKADLKAGGAKAGISGTASVRWIDTANASPAYQKNTSAANVRLNPAAAGPSDLSASMLPITRYHGGLTNTGGVLPNSASTSNAGSSNRDFFSVSNFSWSIDREFDKNSYVHAQFNVNAEGANDDLGGALGLVFASDSNSAGGFSATPTSAVINAGRGTSFTNGDLLVNEAYVLFDDWFSDVDGRAGVWALPMNTEVNGVGRTYNYTITPTIVNSKWEGIRPIGIDIFQDNDKQELWWYLGFFTNGDSTHGAVGGAGSLLTSPTGYAAAAPAGSAEFSGSAAFGNQGGGIVARRSYANPVAASFNNRFMNPAMDVMTDAPAGVTGQALHNDDIGWYALIGTHPKGKDKCGFRWHAAFFDNGGNLRSGSGFPTATEWWAWQLAASYKWNDFYALAQYYNGTSKNNSPVDLIANARRAITPFVNAAEADTNTNAWFALLNYAWDKRGNVTLRYEDARDDTLAAENRASVWTLGLNYKPSHNGWLQLEWIAPTTSATAEDGSGNSISMASQLWQLNYKLAF